ncbi:MAG: amino acid adenylation domain-containing protein [Chthoniobacter sp.]|nr:amino acid adenylation domain-containing protein [Chthoniobacter sp.]
MQTLAGIPAPTTTNPVPQVLAWSRGARAPYPAGKTLHAIFEERVAETPDAIALIDGDRRITYAELDAHANRHASHLRKQGLGAGSYVGLIGSRYWPFIARILGILKIGAAYVPLDPNDPSNRITKLRAHLDGMIEEDLDVSAESAEPGPIAGESTGAAYVMFTSGSTGEPKGVIIPHQGVTRLVCATDFAPFDRETVMLQSSVFCFDASTLEIWGALLHGGLLVFIRSVTLFDHAELATHLARHRINTLFLTTSLFNQLARQAPALFSGLRCVMFGGEAADPTMVNRVFSASRPKHLVNGYGPTETTTFAVCHRIEKEASLVPIGRPIANTDACILDDSHEPVAVGVTGEIYIGGPGVALGYLHRPDLTAARFVETPFGRLYRTGDFGRWLPDGTIEYQGRIDQQFKLRGFRIEPAEIETHLRQHPAVAQCAVLAKTSPFGEKVPVAYLVRRPEHAEVSEGDFRQYCVQHLPPPFVPYQWFWLSELPLTANGKLDHRALPEPTEEARPIHAFAAPENPVQAKLATLWEDVLKRHPIGIHDNFFDLGGHSLVAIQLSGRIREAFHTEMPVHRFFSTPTIAGLATFLTLPAAAVSPTSGSQSLVAIQPGDPTQLPFFLVPGGWGAEVEFLVYGVLARHLGTDRPFYGLKARGSDGVAAPHRSIAGMVADYVTEIRAHQPHGPYLLGGECVGGIATIEIARTLEAQGEKVALVALLGTRPPSRDILHRFEKRERAAKRQRFWKVRIVQPYHEHMERLARLPLGGKLAYLWTRVFRRGSRQVADSATSAAAAGPQESRKFLEHYPRMLMDHKLGSYGGKITLLTDETSLAKYGHFSWEKAHTGELEVHVLPGTHLSYIREHAPTAAAKLREVIDRACANHAA